MKYALISFMLLAGCSDEHRRNCINLVKESYCKPYASARNGYTYVEYDCTGINSPAYDAAVKACIEATK